MSAKTLTKSEIALHWLVGLSMIILTCVGMYMSQNAVFSLYPLHKSVGIILFVFILARVLTRMYKGWPESQSDGRAWEHRLAHAVHWILILSTLALPISGMLDSIMAGRGLSVFGLDLVASNMGTAGRPVAIDETLSNLASASHGIFGKVLIAALTLHIAGALKHHFVDSDGTLARMMGRT